MRRFLFPILLLLGAWPAPAAPKAPDRPVDLNTATLTELLQLPRVGARTAARILAFRKANGPFRRPEEIMNIQGIGEKAFRRLQPHITVGGTPPEGGTPEGGTP